MSGLAVGFAIWAALTGTVGAVMALARTPPDDAVSNLSKWAVWAGLHHVPEWLRNRRADDIAYRWASISLVVLIIVGVLGASYYFLAFDDASRPAGVDEHGRDEARDQLLKGQSNPVNSGPKMRLEGGELTKTTGGYALRIAIQNTGNNSVLDIINLVNYVLLPTPLGAEQEDVQMGLLKSQLLQSLPNQLETVRLATSRNETPAGTATMLTWRQHDISGEEYKKWHDGSLTIMVFGYIAYSEFYNRASDPYITEICVYFNSDHSTSDVFMTEWQRCSSGHNMSYKTP
jgi:hypothetical protein